MNLLVQQILIPTDQRSQVLLGPTYSTSIRQNFQGVGRRSNGEKVKMDSFFLKIKNSESVHRPAFLSPELRLEGNVILNKTRLNECIFKFCTLYASLAGPGPGPVHQ